MHTEVVDAERTNHLALWAAGYLAQRVDALVKAGLKEVAAFSQAYTEFRAAKLSETIGAELEQIDLTKAFEAFKKKTEAEQAKVTAETARLNEELQKVKTENELLKERLDTLEGRLSKLENSTSK